MIHGFSAILHFPEKCYTSFYSDYTYMLLPQHNILFFNLITSNKDKKTLR